MSAREVISSCERVYQWADVIAGILVEIAWDLRLYVFGQHGGGLNGHASQSHPSSAEHGFNAMRVWVSAIMGIFVAASSS